MEREEKKWLRIALNAPALLADPLGNYLVELGAAGVEQHLISDAEGGFQEAETIIAYLPQEANTNNKIEQLRQYAIFLENTFSASRPVELRVELIADEDWGQKWKEFFHPLKIGKRLVVRPSWEEYLPRPSEVVITIDPAMAFGTGSHPTTRLCLMALETLLDSPVKVQNARVLDVGCGTGILAIAAARMGAGEVVGIDTDPEAVLAARKNAALNGLEEISFLNLPVYALAPSFDIIMANLTSSPLIELSSRLIDLLGEGSHLVVSGVLASERERMETEFLRPPLVQVETLVDEDWLCFIFEKEPRR